MMGPHIKRDNVSEMWDSPSAECQDYTVLRCDTV
jgi:hypothetical protein